MRKREHGHTYFYAISLGFFLLWPDGEFFMATAHAGASYSHIKYANKGPTGSPVAIKRSLSGHA